MATFQKISATSLHAFETVRWKGKALYEYYPKLRSFLETRTERTVYTFFTQPKVTPGKGGQPVIHWLAEDMGPQVQSGAAASGAGSADHILAQLRSLVQTLHTGNATEQDWAALLQRCLDQVSPDRIYSDGQRDVVAEWSVTKIGKEGSGRISRPVTASGGTVQPPADTPDRSDTTDRKNPEDVVRDHSEESSPADDIPAEKTTEGSPEETEATPATEKESSPEQIQSSGQEAFTADKPEAVSTETGPDEAVPSGGGRSGWSGRWWWLLVLLALLGVLYWTQCGGWNSGGELLPSEPGVIVPIDSSDIGLDEDSTRFVALGRINILLNEPHRDIEAFAAAFKDAYPGRDFKVVYFDTLTWRVQLQVPSSEQSAVMKELPDKLADFDFIVFPESMFDRNRRPSDPGFRAGNGASWYFDLIQAYGAWDASFGSDQVVVAVVDDGFDLNHPEFAGRIVRPYNVLSRSPAVYSNRNLQHGTHVAGTAVAARDNRNGLAGIAPDCLFMPIQVADRAGNMSITAIVDGILYAINQGAEVINLSLGMYFGPQMQQIPVAIQEQMITGFFKSEEQFWKRILEIAEENGVIVVMAAGNESILAGLDPMQRSPYAIKVAAVGQGARQASFSNFGDYTTISAPGEDIVSSVPGGGFAAMDGTSMASPVVTGAIALARSVRPDISPEEVRELLVDSGRPLPADIGPLLQLSNFIDAVLGESMPPPSEDDCDAVQREIEELQRRIDELLASCDDAGQADTLKIPDNANDLDFLLGRWKSTTPLTNTENEQITLYFTFFRDETGEITLVEPSGMQCSANLSLDFDPASRTIVIDQLGTAACRDGVSGYNPYIVRCQADPTGTAICVGQNKVDAGNQPEFNLVRIN